MEKEDAMVLVPAPLEDGDIIMDLLGNKFRVSLIESRFFENPFDEKNEEDEEGNGEDEKE